VKSYRQEESGFSPVKNVAYLEDYTMIGGVLSIGGNELS
jgi:hypothetical protein